MLRQHHLTTDDSLGCHLGNLAPRRGSGYSSVHYNTTKGKRVYIDLHHLAFVALGEHERLKQGNDLWQVSHLCNNGRCFNHEHLVIEERSDNLVSPTRSRAGRPLLTRGRRERAAATRTSLFTTAGRTTPAPIGSSARVDCACCARGSTMARSGTGGKTSDAHLPLVLFFIYLLS